MSKKGGDRLTPRKKELLRREAISILSNFATGITDEFERSNLLTASTAGELCLKHEDGFRRYDLAEGATDENKLLFFTVISIQGILSRSKSREFISESTHFLLGFLAGAASQFPGRIEQHRIIEHLTRHRALGGLAKRSIKSDQEPIALDYIAQEMRLPGKKTAAFTRAAARLYKEQKIDVSGKTLSRLFEKHSRDNAQHCPGQS
jgi:hypothetical protein